jgi:uncharacterized protein YdhG (YjbR/CyaY superfamily)
MKKTRGKTARKRDSPDKPEGEAAVLQAIAAMPQPDRELAERLHELVRASAPDLQAKLWYGMPAYARSGKVVCFFQAASKFRTRYATLGFLHEARLDDGSLWPVAFALKELDTGVAARVGGLLRKA